MNKLSDIASILVSRYGISQSEAERFVAQMFDAISDTLCSADRQVKVKGLGTFKLQSVSARQSVDVNTGERIVIDARNKITFTPDTGLRDRVNAPFAQFQTVVVNEGVNLDELETDDTDVPETLYEANDSDVASSTMNTLDDDTPDDESATSATEVPVVDVAQVDDEPVQADDLPPKMDDEMAPVSDCTDDSSAVAGTAIAANDVATDCSDRSDACVEDDVQPAPPIAAAPPKVEAQQSVDREHSRSENEMSVSTSAHQLSNDTPQSEEPVGVNRQRIVVAVLVGIIILICGVATYLLSMYHNRLVAQSDRIMELEIIIDNLQHLHSDSVRTATATSGQTVPADTNSIKTANVVAANTQAAAATSVAKPASTSSSDAKSSSAKSKTFDPHQFDSDSRIRTGAYVIVAIDTVITVNEPSPIATISRRFLGPGMDCYLEAVNTKRQFSKGDKVNIPKLKLKKRIRKN